MIIKRNQQTEKWVTCPLLQSLVYGRIKITNQDKFNSYGTLITVLSLLFVIVFASEDYDRWDSLIAFIVAVFGISYIKNKVYFDFKSIVLSFTIAGFGISIFLYSIITYFKPLDYENELFNITLFFITIYSFAFYRKFEKETKLKGKA